MILFDFNPPVAVEEKKKIFGVNEQNKKNYDAKNLPK